MTLLLLFIRSMIIAIVEQEAMVYSIAFATHIARWFWYVAHWKQASSNLFSAKKSLISVSWHIINFQYPFLGRLNQTTHWQTLQLLTGKYYSIYELPGDELTGLKKCEANFNSFID